MATHFYDFTATTANGEIFFMERCRNRVVLIVNTASKCGFTPQFAGLEQLHQRFQGSDLMVLGFPCMQFGRQEFDDEKETTDFCQQNYGVSFTMMKTIVVRGHNALPLFRWLTKAAPGVLGSRFIKWNFTKFLIDSSGKQVVRYAPYTTPEKLVPKIEAFL